MKRLKRLWFWICWPGLYVYFLGSTRTRVLITRTENTLLVKGWWSGWFADESWGLPGGGLRRHEDAAAGAVRELREELGLAISPQQLTQLGTARIREYGISYQAVFLYLELPEGSPLQPQGYELHEARWAAKAELAGSPLKPEVARALAFLARD